jgi:4-amino-4-deoxy-L-arabinose transferase-like glycosyltransferase
MFERLKHTSAGPQSHFDWRVPFVVALLLRLAYVLLYPQQPVRADAANYDALGWSLSQGLGYTGAGADADVYWAPGYPAMLAAVYAIAGHSVGLVRIVQAVLSSFLPVIAGLIAVRLFGRRTALVAALLCAVYPAFIAYSGLLLTETVFMLLVAATVYWLLDISTSSSLTSLVGLGVLVGITSLVRAETMMLPLFAFIALRLFFRDRSTTVRQWIVIYAAVFLTIAPWTVRNYMVTRQLILLTVHDADVLWISSYKEELLELDTEREPYRSLVAGLSQVEAANVLRREGIRNIVDDPGTYLWLSLKRLPRLWIGGHSNVFVGMEDSIGAYLARGQHGVAFIKMSMLGANCLLVLLGAYGAYVAAARGMADTRSLVILGAPVVFVTAVHFVLFATPRFHVPVMPYLLTFAAVAILRLLPERATHRS